MNSESGVLLIRNDGTIQLKGDSKILGEYHLKHRLLAKVKPDGSMGVFMIPEQGANKGKMFAVLPNGPSGKEGVGWERVVAKESTYLRPVFKPLTDKKNSSSSNKFTVAKTSQSSTDEVIDLCDESDNVSSVEKVCSVTSVQSPEPTPVMLFTKDSAAKLNSRSIVVTTAKSATSNSQVSSTNTCTSIPTSARSTSLTPNSQSGQVSVANTSSTVILTTQETNTNSVAQSTSKMSQVSQSDAYHHTAGNVLQKLALNLTERGRVIPNNVSSTKASTVTPPKTSTVTPSVSQVIVTQSGGQTPQTLTLSQGEQRPLRPMQSILSNGLSNTAVKPLTLNNAPRAQNFSSTQIPGIPSFSAPKTSLVTLNQVLPSAACTIRSKHILPQMSSACVSKYPPKVVTIAKPSTPVTVSKETPIQINSVFSLAPVDPIKPWLTNGKNMPLSEVDFWTKAIKLKIPKDILADTRLRKGCSIVLHRTTSHRPRKMRGCRFKDTQCNEACRKSFIKTLMKDPLRKRIMKMRRRAIYGSLCLDIRKKPKDKNIETSIQPKTQTAQSTSVLSTASITSSKTKSSSNVQSAPTVYTTQANQTVPNEQRYVLVRMNGHNVLFPNTSINGNFINLSSVAIGAVGMNANVDPKATLGITANVPNVGPRATMAITTNAPIVRPRAAVNVTGNVGPGATMGLTTNFVPRASLVGPFNTTRTLLGSRISLSAADMITPVRPTLPASSLPSALSLPQLVSYNSLLTGTSVNGVVGVQTSTASVSNIRTVAGGNNQTSMVLPSLQTPQPLMRLSIPSSVIPGQMGTMAQTAPFPVALRAVTSGGVSAPYPVAVRMVNPSSSARPMIQSQLNFNPVRPGQEVAINSIVRPLPVTTTAAISVFNTSASTSNSTTPSVTQRAVEEPVSSYAKSKVNKGIKYYFIPGGVKIKLEPKTTGYGDEAKKHKKHKKLKRSRSPSPESGTEDRASKKQKGSSAEPESGEKILDDIAKVTNETDIEQISKSEISAERIKQLREKLHENQRKLEEYLRQVDS